MKKLKILILSLIFALSGVSILSGSAFVKADITDETALSISSVTEFKQYFSNANNFSKSFILTNDLDFDNQSLSMSYSTFTGTFDGDGYSIKNFKITQGGVGEQSFFGLFSKTQNATIKNLSLSGDITFNFGENNTIYAGAIAGYCENTAIIDCSVDANFKTEEQESLTFDKEVTFGGFVGSAVSGTTFNNCVNYSNLNLTEQEQKVSKIGSIAGRFSSSHMEYIVSYGNITSNLTTSQIGGLVGELEGAESEIINCVYAGTVNSGNAIAGVVAESKPAENKINYDYYLDSNSSAFGTSSFGENVKAIRSTELIKTFFTTNEVEGVKRWHPQKSPWNFDDTWMMDNETESTVLKLQYFQMFKFGFQYDDTKVYDNYQIIESATISGANKDKDEEGFYQFRFKRPVVITLNFVDNAYGYYNLITVLHGGIAMNKNSYQLSDADNKLTITFTANDSTQGRYFFNFEYKVFDCEVSTSDFTQGGVKNKSTVQASPTDKLSAPFTINNDARTFVTQSFGIYTFAYWNLYSFDLESNDWILTQDHFSTSSEISVKLGSSTKTNENNYYFEDGVYYFKDRFKIEAYWTLENAVSFTIENKDDFISSVSVDGSEYIDSPIPVSNSAIITVTVVVKKGYEMQFERFIGAIPYREGEDKTTIMPRDPEENPDTGELTYTFKLDMSKMEITDKILTVSFYTIKEKNENKNNLLWLWITLPIVLVLIIVGIVLFFVFRRYFYIKSRVGGDKNTKNKVKKDDKTKKNDFKDYYY